MAKYSKKIVKKITDLIRADYCTIAELCANVGISESCFYKWQEKFTEFTEAIARARDYQREKMVTESTRSLFKLIQGFYYEDYRTTYVDSGKTDADGKPVKKVKEQILYKKYFGPQLNAIIFCLCNLDPEHWKNIYKYEVTGKNGKSLIPATPDLSKLTDDELEQLEYLLEKSRSKSDVSCSPRLKRLSDGNTESKKADLEMENENAGSVFVAKEKQVKE